MAKEKISISRKIYRLETIKSMQRKIDLLGYKKSYEATLFLNFRLLSAAFIFFIILYFSNIGYLLAPVFTFIYYINLSKLLIDGRINSRREQLDSDALYFFEVLVLALESGRNLKIAIEITSHNIDSELSDEFKKAIEETYLGKSLDEALEGMKKRIPSETINNLILNITQANIFGSNIIETMYNQIDYIRDKRILEMRAKISKIPLKISVISVIFFIPLLMLLILSPIIIEVLG
ncbi:MAG: type II secretion system F family protein [Tenericutes bacterium]|nr:type II secretion system F family protein [Mycoplasmatota bacterium]